MTSLLLASASPRRGELLSSAGIPFDVRPANIDESSIRGPTPEATAALLARAKTEAVRSMPDTISWPLILGVDTLIDLDGRVIEKAEDRASAAQILRMLSGRSHRVISAVCLYKRTSNSFVEDFHETKVTFKILEDDELQWYLDSEEWRGAAGAYKIQGRAACFVNELNGAYSTVVGLPLPLIYGMLRDSGYRFGQSA